MNNLDSLTHEEFYKQSLEDINKQVSFVEDAFKKIKEWEKDIFLLEEISILRTGLIEHLKQLQSSLADLTIMGCLMRMPYPEKDK